MRVATAEVRDESGTVTGYVQYGRSLAHVDSTVDRLWLFIAAGVLGGTLLASLAGLAIAGRAMRPVSALTASAREIAETGDPSRHMPEPKIDDEVGELARTLEQMLRSLDAARAEREAAMKKQREFVADASHELRTPLTSILANLELLQASLDEPGQRGRAGDDRLGAALLAADDAGSSPTCCCSPAPTPARRGAPPPLRPRRGRRQRGGRGGAADGRPRAAGRERARRSGSRATRTSCTG